MAGSNVRTRLIAFFLTQFHPIPENDEWWGKGFTEWTNAAKARPLFPGHYQPHLPADLGFYDLRLRETRRAQIALAKRYGIDGFCYHYYWFSGRRVLEQPLDDMLADPGSDMPFCICWANENWTRRWDAAEHEVLLAQEHRPDDDVRFIADLAPILKDPRYISQDGAPLLIVYRPQRMPDARKSASIWRDYCRSIGIPSIHLCAALTHGNWDFQQFGFDSGVEFPPHNLVRSLPNHAIEFYRPFHGHVFDYRDIAQQYLSRKYSPEWPGFRSVFPSWDNTARRGDSAVIVLNGTPQNYEHWLSEALRKTEADFPGQDRPVFINAWNEWAEGCHLEPDQKNGLRFLAATLRAKRGQSKFSDFLHSGIRKIARIPKPQARAAWWRRALEGAGLSKLSWIGARKLGRKEIKRRYRKYRERLEVLQADFDRVKARDATTSLQYQQLGKSYSDEKNQNQIRGRLIDALRREIPGYQPDSKPMPLLMEPMAALPSPWVVPEGAARNRATGRVSMSAEYVAAVDPVHVGGHQRYHSQHSVGTRQAPLPERFAARTPYDSAPQAFQQAREAVVFTWMGAVMHQPGRLIDETTRAARAYDGDLRVIPGASRQDGILVFDPQAVGKVVSTDQRCLLAYHGSSGAYGHWWFDSIPAIWLWRDELKRGEILLLLPRDTPRWIHAILDVVGVPESVRLETNDNALHVRECIVATSCSISNLVKPPPIMADIGRQLAASIAGPSGRGRKLYLTRASKAANWSRVLENEEEIVSALARDGYESIDPAALSITEQITLFAQADSIVSPHGSALANIIFAPKGCGIVDLMPDVWTNVPSVGWIYDTTNIMDQQYACLLGETTWRSEAMVEHRSVPMRDLSMRYRVDVDAVMRAAAAMRRA
jgi:capsular polysaccharide biosynthesis protein